MIEFFTGAGAPMFIFALITLVLLFAMYFKNSGDQIKSKIGESWFYSLDAFIRGAVDAAEAIAEANGMVKAGETKLEWVKSWTTEFMRLTGNKIPASIIVPMIESAVSAMNKYSGLDRFSTTKSLQSEIVNIRPIDPLGGTSPYSVSFKLTDNAGG